jgi:hypothetical protein
LALRPDLLLEEGDSAEGHLRRRLGRGARGSLPRLRPLRRLLQRLAPIQNDLLLVMLPEKREATDFRREQASAYDGYYTMGNKLREGAVWPVQLVFDMYNNRERRYSVFEPAQCRFEGSVSPIGAQLLKIRDPLLTPS